MDELRENLKKLVLAGVGAMAVATEKTRVVLDDLAQKGEETVEKGKAAGESLKDSIQKKLSELSRLTPDEMDAWLNNRTEEEKKMLWEKLSAFLSKERSEDAPEEDAPGEDAAEEK